jgi:hypothetical protein
LLKISPLLLYIGPPEKTKVLAHQELQLKPSQGHYGQHMKFYIGQSRIHRDFASSQRKHLDHAACRPLRSFSTHPDPVSARRAFGFGFVAQSSNPDGFVANRHKPRRLGAASTPIPLMIDCRHVVPA